jgi:hypothetical protein
MNLMIIQITFKKEMIQEFLEDTKILRILDLIFRLRKTLFLERVPKLLKIRAWHKDPKLSKQNSIQSRF